MRRFFSWSLPIGTYLNIAVRVHLLFFLFLLFELLKAPGDVWWTLRKSSLLFISVLLHEFGHALACRGVGGTAHEILMWPLGGLAFVAPPRTPWAWFVTVICGPLVNVAIMAGCYATLLATHGADVPVGFNPFNPWLTVYAVPGVPGILADLFVVNYVLFLFNMVMVFHPFDGGRLVQIALWKAIGYYRSMLAATRFGMAGAVAVAIYGVAMRNTLLIGIAIFGFLSCYQEGMILRQFGAPSTRFGAGAAPGIADEDDEYGAAASALHEPKIGWLQRMRARSASKRRAAARAEEARLEAEVDRILVKVKDQGLQSLTEKEKKTLQRATEKQRRVRL